ncbi:MAG: DNA methyltransferase [Chthoniobacterales bacterium]
MLKPVDDSGEIMTWADFKKKWSRYSGKETSAYQEHFNDLCHLLWQPTPAAADPTGSESFCFQKRVIKDAELFAFTDKERVAEDPEMERGFADVWKLGCFAWEYKGKKKNLDEAYRQLLRYRESLLNPPLLIVCDFDRYIIRTNFNGTVQETHEFTNAQIDDPAFLAILGAAFADPEFLKPQRTTAEVTENLAQQIGEVARSLQKRESIELVDAKTRREHSVAQRKNLRIARFLNRIVFCFFAEDTGLLPKHVVTDIFKTAVGDPQHFAEVLEELFRRMAKGGTFGPHKIRHFNGHLFEEASVFELTEEEIGKLATAGEADWQFIQPSIMGNLFERGLDPDQRAQLGAHYTSEEDIKTLVEPVLMAPLRRDGGQIKSDLAPSYLKGKGNPAERAKLSAFHSRLATISVLDPACGSGNFLYVSLQLLLDLEKELITFATQLGFKFEPRVSVQQLRAIELNAYAFELAQVAVQIGYLKWRRDNGWPNEKEPVLQELDGFLNEDALLVPHYRSKAKTLKEAQAVEHGSDDALKFYSERKWPDADVIIGNPPFLGDKKMKRALGPAYVNELRRIYKGRVRGNADLCCYWFEKARELISSQPCSRAGLLATQNIRGGASRKVLDAIKASGDIYFAISDREWILDGAMVHISMVGFDSGHQVNRSLDGRVVENINADLTASVDVTTALTLPSSTGIAFIGSCKGGPFDLDEAEALELLHSGGNPNSLPNSDLVRPRINTDGLTNKRRGDWIIDTRDLELADASRYEGPFSVVVERVKPLREKNNDRWLRANWWRPQRMRPEMRAAIQNMARFICTPTTSTHRIFSWVQHPVIPDHKLVVIAREDDFDFGVFHSRIHETWSRAVVGTQLREKESGQNYNVDTAVETFAFPRPTSEQADAIRTAARELNGLRENWLNPAEWTATRALEFPGSANGPWSRFVHEPDERGIGTVRYPRIEPRDDECAKKIAKRTLTNLYNERPTWLTHAHAKLDGAVAAAYGFPVDLGDDGILERLLALNRERASQEGKTKIQRRRASREKHAEEML